MCILQSRKPRNSRRQLHWQSKMSSVSASPHPRTCGKARRDSIALLPVGGWGEETETFQTTTVWMGKRMKILQNFRPMSDHVSLPRSRFLDVTQLSLLVFFVFFCVFFFFSFFFLTKTFIRLPKTLVWDAKNGRRFIVMTSCENAPVYSLSH